MLGKYLFELETFGKDKVGASGDLDFRRMGLMCGTLQEELVFVLVRVKVALQVRPG